MPAQRPLPQRGNVRQPFLQVARAEVAQPAVGGSGELLGGVALGGGEECDRLRTPAGDGAGARDALAQL